MQTTGTTDTDTVRTSTSTSTSSSSSSSSTRRGRTFRPVKVLVAGAGVLVAVGSFAPSAGALSPARPDLPIERIIVTPPTTLPPVTVPPTTKPPVTIPPVIVTPEPCTTRRCPAPPPVNPCTAKPVREMAPAADIAEQDKTGRTLTTVPPTTTAPTTTTPPKQPCPPPARTPVPRPEVPPVSVDVPVKGAVAFAG